MRILDKDNSGVVEYAEVRAAAAPPRIARSVTSVACSRARQFIEWYRAPH